MLSEQTANVIEDYFNAEELRQMEVDEEFVAIIAKMPPSFRDCLIHHPNYCQLTEYFDLATEQDKTFRHITRLYEELTSSIADAAAEQIVKLKREAI